MMHLFILVTGVVSDPVLLSYSLNVSGGGDTLQDGAVSSLLKDD